MAYASPILSEQQNLARSGIVNGTLDSPFRVLKGPAGSGKSLVIAGVYDDLGEKLCVLAPTHTAAANLEEMGIPRVYQAVSLTQTSKNSLANKLYLRGVTHVIVDEASMITRTQKLIIDDICMRAGIHLTYVGDPYQLPPVDKLLPVFEQDWFPEEEETLYLDMVFRQEAGVTPYLVRDTSIDPHGTHICMTNEKRNELNIACHEALFGDDAYADKAKTILNPQPGQYLMSNETSKSYTDSKTGLTKITFHNNGLYQIEWVKRTRFHFEIKFVGVRKAKQISKKEFSVENLERNGERGFDLAYAITCHSAQGKGFDNVYVHIECNLLDKGEVNQWDYALPDIEIDNWLYTALTRGKKSITVVDLTGAVAREGLSLSIDPKGRAKPKAEAKQEPTKTVPVFKTAEAVTPVEVIEPVAATLPSDEGSAVADVADKPRELDDDTIWEQFLSAKPPTLRQLTAEEVRIKEEQDKEYEDYLSTFRLDPFAARKAMLERMALEAA